MNDSIRTGGGRLGKAPSDDAILEMSRLPKVDLHRHLEGSLYPEFVLDLARKHKINLPAATVEELRPLIQITEKDQTLLDFIRKFDTLALLFKNRQIVKELTYEVILSAHRDKVYYVELRFAPTYMASKTGLDYHEIIEGVLEGRDAAAKDLPDTKTGLILIVNREAPPAAAKEMLGLAMDYRQHGIAAMDLAGDELNYPPMKFREIFQQAREAGLFVTLHAGEALGADSVEIAVRQCKAQRIGHGVRISGDAKVEKLVIDENVPLEICPTSNVQTGAVARWQDHPLKSFLEKKIPVTVNTDDPGVSGITLSHEYARLRELYGISPDALKALCMAGVESAFISDLEKDYLRKRVRAEWERIASV